MTELEEKLEKIKLYIGKTDRESRANFDKMIEEIRSKYSDNKADKTIISRFVDAGLKECRQDISAIEASISEGKILGNKYQSNDAQIVVAEPFEKYKTNKS